MKSILFYQTSNNKKPFEKWLQSLDNPTQIKITNNLDKLTIRNLGDCKNIGDGVKELRLHFGSGYRIYYAEHKNIFILLLVGGDKSSQQKDIKKAKQYLQDFLTRIQT